jgi:hypothetical protein
MIKFNKNTLTELAGLGSGAVGAAYVQQKLLIKRDEAGAPKVNEEGEVETLFGAGATANLIVDIAPAAVGLFLQGQKGIFIKEAGKGMIAASVGGLIKKQFADTLGITGTDTLLGQVDMMPSDMGDDRPMMGYSSSAYDDTSADAGEMDF